MGCRQEGSGVLTSSLEHLSCKPGLQLVSSGCFWPKGRCPQQNHGALTELFLLQLCSQLPAPELG